tara:strand:- start:480 stop:1019 length:540 start_codon:yes stop_codon:yes gene_type:complete
MIYRPPYWYHDNIEFNQEQLNQLKLELELIGSEKYAKNKEHISTYFITENKRPDKNYNNVYCSIVEDITKSVGLYYKTKYHYTYWSQLYEKGMTHKPHHHAHEDSKMDSEISWVHFIDVPKQKCFRFTDTMGNTLVPEEQKNGDIICFPSWVWHEVLPNETDDIRVVVSGNITITHYDD